MQNTKAEPVADSRDDEGDARDKPRAQGDRSIAMGRRESQLSAEEV